MQMQAEELWTKILSLFLHWKEITAAHNFSRNQLLRLSTDGPAACYFQMLLFTSDKKQPNWFRYELVSY